MSRIEARIDLDYKNLNRQKNETTNNRTKI
jgi:hypothetical protein